MEPNGDDPSEPGAVLKVLQEAEVTKGLNKLILREASDYRRLLALVDEHGSTFHALNTCTLFHRLAKALAKEGSRLSERSSEMQQLPVWSKLIGMVYRQAPDCNNMELTNCLWAIATLEARGPAEQETAVELLKYCLQFLDTFSPRNLALSAWALAKMGNRDPAWCRAWAECVRRTINAFDTRDMTMVVWAFATVHWKDEAFLHFFCREVETKIESGGPQDIGNTLWALATLAFKHEGALAALSTQCFQKAETFDQQNLSIAMWSYATLGYKNMNLFHHITQLITERIKTFASQGVANTVWACAKFQFQQKCLLMTVAEEIIPRLDDFEPQHLAIVAWAYATLEFPNRPLLTALCQAGTRKMHIFSAQHMANMTWAMATLAHKDEEYLRRMVLRALEAVETFNPQECSNLAWALALLTFRDDTLLAALSRRSQEIVHEFIPQNLGNTAWAYNRLGYRDDDLMRTIVQQAALRLDECQGQELLDVVESIATGGYTEVVDQTYWGTLMSWTCQKYEVAQRFLFQNSHLPLTLPPLSEFDRALAVQDYRDQLASFDLIGLGFTYTSQLLTDLGVKVLDGAELEEWQDTAKAAASTAKHETDQDKNAEAQEGLKACRTVCVYRYDLRVDGPDGSDADGAASQCGPTALTSGPADDDHELGLFAATLRHFRGGDGEFQALQACSRACAGLGCRPAVSTRCPNVAGEMWLYVSEVPCLSCVGAMAQFRQLFPRVSLSIAFTLGRQPAIVNDIGGRSAGDAPGPAFFGGQGGGGGARAVEGGRLASAAAGGRPKPGGRPFEARGCGGAVNGVAAGAIPTLGPTLTWEQALQAEESPRDADGAPLRFVPRRAAAGAGALAAGAAAAGAPAAGAESSEATLAADTARGIMVAGPGAAGGRDGLLPAPLPGPPAPAAPRNGDAASHDLAGCFGAGPSRPGVALAGAPLAELPSVAGPAPGLPPAAAGSAVGWQAGRAAGDPTDGLSELGEPADVSWRYVQPAKEATPKQQSFY